MNQDPWPGTDAEPFITPVMLKTLPGRTRVCDDQSNEYDCLDEADSKILRVLMAEPKISVQAFLARLPADEPEAKFKRRDTRVTRYTTSLAVILYGSAVFAEDVGDFLTNCVVFLQRPFCCDRNVPYRNPQSLSGLDENAPMTLDLEDLVSSVEIETLAQNVDLAAALETGDTFPETEAPIGVRTSLHR